MNKKSISIIVITILINHLCICQNVVSESILQLSLVNKEYNSLYIKCLLIDKQTGLVKEFENISGKKQGQYDWEFIIPDSIYNDLIVISKITELISDTIQHAIAFSFFDSSTMDEWGTFSFLPDKGFCRIEAEYIETRNRAISLQVGGHVIHDRFLYKEVNSNKKFLSSVQELRRKASLYKLSYEEKLAKSEKLFKENPDSKMYITMLYHELNGYKSKQDIKRLYDCFSESMKHTISGKKIEEYLSFEIFPNEELILNGSAKKEYIIKDSSRPNLILFSASWCAPCHKLIPDLKKIYNDLNSKINFTYVSIDDKTTKEQWSKLMFKEDIPWRSLVIDDKDIARIRDKYFVQGVPLSYLVQPDGSFERIDIREKQDMDKLYKNMD